MMSCSRWLRYTFAGLVLAALGACASGPARPKPAELGPDPALFAMRSAWSTALGRVDFPMHVQVNGDNVVLADSQGVVATLDARTGMQLWRVALNTPLSAGVGSDGRFTAVVSRDNELITLDGGHEAWRARLTAQVFTAPLVAGLRVFVLDAEHNLSAFDAQSGRRLWQSQRSGDALVLRQAGILTAVGNTLVAGMSGHLVGVNPLTGSVLWDAPVATPRSTNDIERLVDLVDGVSRNGDALCVRAFQAAVACVDTTQGKVLWKRAAEGFTGLQGDGKQVYGVEADGRLLAWRTRDGEPAWSSDALRYRQLTSALPFGRALAIGDGGGLVHLLSRTDGTLLTRLATDGSAIAVTPVLAGATLVVVSHNGGVFGFVPR